MSENHGPVLDREISLKGLGLSVGALIALVVVAAALMWFLSGVLRDAVAANDPPLPLLPEARRAWEPPGPRLQTDPAAEMAALRAAESEALGTWGWVDEANGVARIPIERAMELVVEGERAAAPAQGALP